MKIKAHLCLTVSAAVLSMPVLGLAQEVSLTRVATMPGGAEVTGLSVNGRGEVFLNAQHPGGDNAFSDGASPALLGYIHGFDSAYSGPGVALPEESVQAGVEVASGEYVTLGRAGDMLGSGQVLGGVYDTSGALMYVSNAPDFNGFVPLGENEAYLYTGWEGAGRDGAGAISRLKLLMQDGKWQADAGASDMMDLAPIGGGAVICSGVITPWGTPLLAEEYFYYNTAVWNHPDNYDDDERPGYKGGNDKSYIKPKNMMQYMGGMANPYRSGYFIEIVNPESELYARPVKRYATGRLSHETAAIMPDNRTIYMSDDDSAIYSDKVYNTASGGVLFKFVADKAGDLSSGTLFAAKLTQDAGSTDPDTTGFDVSWIALGHANEAEVERWVAEYDDVTVADYVDGETSYVSDDEIRAWAETQSGSDLDGDGSVAQAPDARAAFLEARRTAAALGATNEWDKLEGVTTQGNNVYVAASALSFTMDKGWGSKDWSTGAMDAANPGDIALDAEKCGATYKAVTGDDYDITRLEPFVVGQATEDGRCSIDRPANPDNILALADGTMLIGEDSGPKKHVLDMVWMAK